MLQNQSQELNHPSATLLEIAGNSAISISDNDLCNFEERSAILEFDAGLPRDKAEVVASLIILMDKLNEVPA